MCFSVVSAFSPLIWLFLAGALLLFIVMFLVVYKVYCKHLWYEELATRGLKSFDVVFKVVGTLVEPDSFTIFIQNNKWSAGNETFWIFN